MDLPKMISAKRQDGLTLVELMVAIAIALMVLAAMSQAFVSTSATRSEIDRAGRQVENGRYALALLSSDLKLAGYYGEFAGVGASMEVPADVCAVDSLENLGWGAGLYPAHVTGFTNASPDCVADRKAGTDVIMIRRVSTETTAVAGASATDVYLQTSGCSSDTETYVVALGAAGAGTFDLSRKDCATASELRRYLVHIYYIDEDMILQRQELREGAWADPVALVDGIEDMRIEYALDTDGDGAPEQTGVLASAIGDDCVVAVECWENVVSATVYLLSRNPEPSPGHVDDKTYRLGSVTLDAFNDAFKRHVYSVTVPFVNPAGRRE